MTPKQFARGVAAEKNALVKGYFARSSETAVAENIRELKLTQPQLRGLQVVIDRALTDMCYTLLLALDGEAKLGTLPQQEFRLLDEDGHVLTGGDLEAAAWDVFQSEAH